MIHLLLFPFGCGNLGTQAFLSMIRERERERERGGEKRGEGWKLIDQVKTKGCENHTVVLALPFLH